MKRWVDQIYLLDAAREIDLFHGTNYFAPLKSPFPTVLTVHDLAVQLFPQMHPLRRRLRHRLLSTLCRRSARVIVDSRSTRADVVSLLGVPEDRIDVVCLAVDESFHRVDDPRQLDRVRLRYGLPQSFILFVGAIEPRKNLPSLLRAVASLRREGSAPPLVVAGSGRQRYVERLQGIARAEGLEFGRDVFFTGYVDDADLPVLYSLCEVFVYPSLYEGFGLPPLEAMACGAPAVVLNNASARELYGGCSLTVDEAGLAEGLSMLLGDPGLREKLVERGLERARSRNWDTVAAETLDVYRRALAPG